MPEVVLTSHSTSGWPTGGRTDLPAYNPHVSVPNGQTTQNAVGRFGLAAAADVTVRRPTYEYVDTGFHQVHQTHVLWSDSASWCTIITLWHMGRAGLAHVIPGTTAAASTQALLNLFNAVPTEIHMATTPDHFTLQDGILRVRATVQAHYGGNYAGVRVFRISGYNGHDWEQKHQLAVDPRTGAYPVFN